MPAPVLRPEPDEMPMNAPRCSATIGGRKWRATLAIGRDGVETVVAANPELIVISRPMGVEHTWESKWLDYPSVAAVRFGQIKVINADLISRPGTRLIDGVARLCEMIGSTDGALRANRH